MEDSNTLLKKIKLLNQSILIIGYNNSLIVRDLYQEDLIELVNCDWVDEFKKEYYDAPDLKLNSSWSTFENCTYIKLNYDDNQITFDVDLYDGDNLSGMKTNHVWVAKFATKNIDILLQFSEFINLEFNIHLNDLLDQEDELIRIKRLEKLEKKLLS